MDPLAAEGVALEPRSLLHLRHIARHMRPLQVRRHSMLPGGLVTRRRGRGLEPDDIRPWMHGDDIRHIDRNMTARTGEPHVRTFRDEREHVVLLVADFRPSMLFGTRRAFRSVAAAESLALIGWRTIDDGGRVGLLASTGEDEVFVRPANGERAMHPVAGGLAQAHRDALAASLQADLPLDVLVQRADRLTPRGGTVVLASAMHSEGAGFDAAVQALVHRAVLHAVLVVDSFELAPPPGNYPYVTLEGERGWAQVGCQRKSSSIEARIERLSRLGVSVVTVRADVPPERIFSTLGGAHG